MSRIRILPDKLVSQIAAGEVVERPASVVKELVENALDAGAGAVEVELEAGGKRRVRVSDDGSGMDRDDVLLAFDRHATSKIGSMEDLERIGTLGFRGEALASIASVARVELTTAAEPGEGQRVRIDAGRVQGVEALARGRGTTVDVSGLFFSVPARRTFLKTPRTELRRALEVVQGYALARPDVRFRVRHEGRALLEAAPVEESPEGALERIAQLFGSRLASALVEIGDGGDRRERLWGFLGDPSTCRGRRLFVFVNRRLLRDRGILATFYRAVRERWKKEDFPALFLFLDLPPEEVDVNVHPQKAEVRFRDAGLLRRLRAVLVEALDRARGEEEAPLEEASGRPTAPLAWDGAGTRFRDARASDAPDSVAEGEGPRPGAGRLAEVAYAPPPPRPVPLSGRSGELRSFRMLGQYKGTLVLLEGPDGLYLVDQHVAHERILYERLRRALRRDEPAVQSLLDPVLLELGPAERERLEELQESLAGHGFSLRRLSGGTLALTAVPSVLSADEAERLVVTLAADGSDTPASPEDLGEELLDALAASLACRGAVKMHHPLSGDEMAAMLSELFAAEQPYACPHGRPIVLRMTDRELEKRFGRR